MSQASLTIVDGTGDEMLTQFNNVNSALASRFAGATDPATAGFAVAYMWWYDTGNNLVKQRNDDNDAWITKGVILANGTTQFSAAALDTAYLPLAGGTITGPVIYKKSADIASATSLDLTTATGNIVHITGAVTIATAIITAGQILNVVFDGAPLLTHGSTLVCPTAANIQAAAGDRCTIVGDASNVANIVSYQKANGTPLSGGGVGGGNYFGDESDGAKTFAATTYLGQNKITNYAIASNVLTITTSSAHGLATNDIISIAQCTLTAANTTQMIGTYGTTAGTHYRVVTGTPTDTTFTVALTNADVASTAEVNVDATVCQWDGPAVVKNYTALVVNSGVTVTTAARCKGLILYCKSKINSGLLTMTGRGASATGADSGLYVFVPYVNDPNNNILTPYPIPADGALGGAAVSGSGVEGLPGVAGVDGETGGGGGSATYGTTGVPGAPGTSYSGGAAAGGSAINQGVAGADDGGPGGNGNGTGSTNHGTGGAGNPGGTSTSGASATNGTGGLLIVWCEGDFTNEASGVIESNGCKGADANGTNTSCAGGGSGGGSVSIFHGGTAVNNGTIRANGGLPGVATGTNPYNGGYGGAGTTRLVKVAA